MSEPIIAQSPFVFTLPGSTNGSGNLHFWENLDLFPNGIQRCFWISQVKEGETRGNHAHRQESQVLVALAGVVTLEIHTVQAEVFSFELHSPEQALFVPPLNWLVARFSQHSVLLGLSDRIFSEDDYIRDFDYFGKLQESYK